jgi:hypothetical protein
MGCLWQADKSLNTLALPRSRTTNRENKPDLAIDEKHSIGFEEGPRNNNERHKLCADAD